MLGLRPLAPPAPYPYQQIIQPLQGITGPKSAHVDVLARPIAPLALLLKNGWDCKRLLLSNVLAICGIKPLMKFSFILAVCLQTVPELLVPFVSTGALKILCTLSLDVTFSEDDCRVRSMHAPHNLALVRRFAVNTLNP